MTSEFDVLPFSGDFTMSTGFRKWRREARMDFLRTAAQNGAHEETPWTDADS